MRRITIFADEETARKAVAWLEENGLDFMSEDYVPPQTARHPPQRRSVPERPEASNGFLTPLRRPGKRTPRSMLLSWLKESGSLSRTEIIDLTKDAGWYPKIMMDTLRRMVKAKQLVEYEAAGMRLYRLVGGENDG